MVLTAEDVVVASNNNMSSDTKSCERRGGEKDGNSSRERLASSVRPFDNVALLSGEEARVPREIWRFVARHLMENTDDESLEVNDTNDEWPDGGGGRLTTVDASKTRLVKKFLAKEVACMASDLKLSKMWLPDSWPHNFPGLKRLQWDLACWEFIHDEGVDWKCIRSRVTASVRQLRQLQSLESLTLLRCELLDDEAMRYIGELTKLRKLHLHGGEFVTAAGVAELKHLDNLTELGFDSCYRLNDRAVSELTPHTSLKHLTLRGSRYLTDSGLAPLAALIRLESLDLTDNPSIEGFGFKALFTSLPKLSTLKLSNCRRLFHNGPDFLRNAKNVTDLDISFCELVSDFSMEALRSHLPRLSKLSLAGCNNFRNRSLASLAYLESLSSLNVAGSIALRDNGLALIQGYPSLTHLDISSCANITDVGLACLASQTNLKHLSLNSCSKISDVGVATLTSLTNLETFSADECKRVTWMSVAFLGKSLASLKSASPLEPEGLAVSRSTV